MSGMMAEPTGEMETGVKTEADYPCQRCNHSPEWHRLDDSTNVSPVDAEAKFRCLGPDFKGCDGACPDYVEPEGYLDWIAERGFDHGVFVSGRQGGDRD